MRECAGRWRVGSVEEAFLEHVPGAVESFLAGLEHQEDSAGKSARLRRGGAPRRAASPCGCRDRRRASGRRTRTRTAGRSPREAECIHVGAEEDRRAGPGPFDRRHDRADASCRATARGRSREARPRPSPGSAGGGGRPRGSGGAAGAVRRRPGARRGQRQARDVWARGASHRRSMRIGAGRGFVGRSRKSGAPVARRRDASTRSSLRKSPQAARPSPGSVVPAR